MDKEKAFFLLGTAVKLNHTISAKRKVRSVN